MNCIAAAYRSFFYCGRADEWAQGSLTTAAQEVGMFLHASRGVNSMLDGIG